MCLRPCRKIVRCVKSHQAGIAAQQQQHVKNPRRYAAPGQRGAERLGELAQADLGGVGGLAHRRLDGFGIPVRKGAERSEEHTSELQSLMRISYAVFCLKKKINTTHAHPTAASYQ